MVRAHKDNRTIHATFPRNLSQMSRKLQQRPCFGWNALLFGICCLKSFSKKTIKFYVAQKKRTKKQTIKKKNQNLEKKMYLSPTSGYEIAYEPNLWTRKQNCYAYALNYFGQPGFLQPGHFAGIPRLRRGDVHTCDDLLFRIQQDNPQIYTTDFETPCHPDFYKGFLALDATENDSDYHFYRQDPSGYWSHKLGKNPVSNVDASQQKISNPSIANRSYSHFDYNKPCFFFCVPRR